MRLSYLLLLAAATLAATLDATSAASGVILSTQQTANALDPVNPKKMNNPRFLRVQKKVDVADEDKENEEGEERMWSGVSGWVSTNVNAAKATAKLARAKSFNSLSHAIKNLDDADEIGALFMKFKPQLKNMFPDFEDGMSLNQFTAMVLSSRTDDQALLAIAAYKKYLVKFHPGLA